MLASALGALLSGCVLLAIFGPEGRVNALASSVSGIASTAAAIAAVWLGREALARTDAQTREAQRSTELSRYPLLLPLHQPVGPPDDGGTLTRHPPAAVRYIFKPSTVGGHAFLEVSPDHYLLPMENIGEGPALRVIGLLHRSDGFSGRLHGVDALGAGGTAYALASLTRSSVSTPETVASALADHSATLWLEINYEDVFGRDRSLLAVFQPAGMGYWHVVTGHQAEPP